MEEIKLSRLLFSLKDYQAQFHTSVLLTYLSCIDPQPGMVLALSVERNGRKQQVPATVLAADHQSVTVDYNHPLAGKTITYTVKLLAIGS